MLKSKEEEEETGGNWFILKRTWTIFSTKLYKLRQLMAFGNLSGNQTKVLYLLYIKISKIQIITVYFSVIKLLSCQI